jgi:hypothetical protein
VTSWVNRMRLTKHVYPSAILNFHVGWINELLKQKNDQARWQLLLPKPCAIIRQIIKRRPKSDV